MADKLPGGMRIEAVEDVELAENLHICGYISVNTLNTLTEKIYAEIDRLEQPKTNTKRGKTSGAPTMTKKTTKEIGSAVTEETKNNLQLQVGKAIYETLAALIERRVLKLSFIQRMFSSAAKRDAAVMVVMYGAIHLLRTRYDHYAFESLTRYLNHRAQTEAFGLLLDSSAVEGLLQCPTKK
jgi:hypothetical protein